jgi:hypothetical protein
MREPQGFAMGAGIWGLGTMTYVEAPNGDFVFGHDGANDPAINSSVRINPETSDGIVVLFLDIPHWRQALAQNGYCGRRVILTSSLQNAHSGVHLFELSLGLY